MERRLGGQLLDKPKQIAFQDGGQNLCLTIEELASGWRSKLAANYQVGLLISLTNDKVSIWADSLSKQCRPTSNSS